MKIRTTNNDQNNRGDGELEKRLRTLWLGRRDSNPRMPGSKPGALPLGHALLYLQIEF